MIYQTYSHYIVIIIEQKVINGLKAEQSDNEKSNLYHLI